MAGPEVKEHLTEEGISSRLLRLSVFVVFGKLLHQIFDRKWLEALDSGIGSVLAAPFWLWACIMSLMSAFVPIVCWIAMAVMTWFTIFLDTCIPGVYPPTFVSTKKRWFLWPTTFHLGHATAIINLLIVSFLMYRGFNNSVSV